MIFLGGLAYLGLLAISASAMELSVEHEAKRHKREPAQEVVVPTLKSRAFDSIMQALDAELTKRLKDQALDDIDSKKFFSDLSIDKLPVELQTELFEAISRNVTFPVYHKEAQVLAFSPTGNRALFRCIKHKGLYVEDLFGRSSLRSPSVETCCFPGFSKRFATLSPEGATIFAWRKNQTRKDMSGTTIPTLIDSASGTMHAITTLYKRYGLYGVFVARNIFMMRKPKRLEEITITSDALLERTVHTVVDEDNEYPVNQLKNCIVALSETAVALLGPDCGTAHIFSCDAEGLWKRESVVPLPDRFGHIYGMWGKQSLLWEGFQKFARIDLESGKSFQYVPQSHTPFACTAWSDATGESAVWLKKIGNADKCVVHAVDPMGNASALEVRGNGASNKFSVCYPSAIFYLFGKYLYSFQS